jgi:transglutaminase-like putative cysteine protease
MKLRVVHETRYDYEPPVETARHIVHLRPRQTQWQRLINHELVIAPVVVERSERLDVWGNTRMSFALQTTHRELRVVADSVVLTQAPPPASGGRSWDAVSEGFHYCAGGRWHAAAEFVFPSEYVPRHDDYLGYARDCFAPGVPVLDASMALTRRIHRDFTYASASTDIDTPAVEALAARRGVCQDFAHVMIGCLRARGLAARYVSGYLLTAVPGGAPRLVGSDASHAWVSVFAPDDASPEGGQWHDFDPTNDRQPGEDYVTLAWGRDFGDVSPMRGLLQGGGDHLLEVGVTVDAVD